MRNIHEGRTTSVQATTSKRAADWSASNIPTGTNTSWAEYVNFWSGLNKTICNLIYAVYVLPNSLITIFTKPIINIKRGGIIQNTIWLPVCRD
jgi:hypothetical protein